MEFLKIKERNISMSNRNIPVNSFINTSHVVSIEDNGNGYATVRVDDGRIVSVESDSIVLTNKFELEKKEEKVIEKEKEVVNKKAKTKHQKEISID